jgi:hypothetical protein
VYMEVEHEWSQSQVLNVEVVTWLFLINGLI